MNLLAVPKFFSQGIVPFLVSRPTSPDLNVSWMLKRGRAQPGIMIWIVLLELPADAILRARPKIHGTLHIMFVRNNNGGVIAGPVSTLGYRAIDKHLVLTEGKGKVSEPEWAIYTNSTGRQRRRDMVLSKFLAQLLLTGL
jgi:hypothetical protein